MKWINCSNNKGNYISHWVYFNNPIKGESGVVKGPCIDHDETGFSVRYKGITWNVNQISLRPPQTKQL